MHFGCCLGIKNVQKVSKNRVSIIEVKKYKFIKNKEFTKFLKTSTNYFSF